MTLSWDLKEVITSCRENCRVGEISLMEEIGTVIEDWEEEGGSLFQPWHRAFHKRGKHSKWAGHGKAARMAPGSIPITLRSKYYKRYD